MLGSRIATGKTSGCSSRARDAQQGMTPSKGISSDVERHKGPVLVMPPPRHKPSLWQVWRARLVLVEFVFVCVVIGIILLIAPWTSLWTSNSLLATFPRVREFMMRDFVRGIVSGLGIVDIWLGVGEAIHYRDYME